MPRPKKKPDFDAEALLGELMDTVIAAYENQHADLRDIAEELGLSTVKVRKLLITAGERQGRQIYIYRSEIKRALSAKVLELYKEEKSIWEIMEATGLKQAAVYSYLPYVHGAYNMPEVSTGAKRVKRFRERVNKCNQFSERMAALRGQGEVDVTSLNDILWQTLHDLQGCVFHTNKGLRFRYTVRGGEMFVDRKEKSKSLTKSTVFLAFRNAIRLQQEEGFVSGPKRLGTFGASYLFPIFLRLGVCTATKIECNIIGGEETGQNR